MKIKRTDFNQISHEFEIIEQTKLRTIKGGTGNGEVEWGVDDAGNLYFRIDGGAWMGYTITLKEVEIRGTAPAGFQYSDLQALIYDSGQGGWSSTGNYNYGGNGGGSTGGGGGGGGGGGTTPTGSSFNTGSLLSTGSAESTALTIVGALNTTFGLTANASEMSAIAAQLEIKSTFNAAGKIFAVLDVLTNTYELFETEQTALQQMEDVGQIVGAVVITFAVSNPVGMIVGGVALSAWSIWELYRDQPTTGGGGNGDDGSSTNDDGG